ncbi:hypothetical protein V6N12_039260 [Hibiscus sabdariffa]|uniref:Uncharacterized protein n=1 Tax=Hibiscus sabdariffa TaxID=183260 RepID=A0ABR2E068_9ROSI
MQGRFSQSRQYCTSQFPYLADMRQLGNSKRLRAIPITAKISSDAQLKKKRIMLPRYDGFNCLPYENGAQWENGIGV